MVEVRRLTRANVAFAAVLGDEGLPGDRRRARRPHGRRRDLRRADRPARELDRLPGRRGRRERHPSRAAGGRPARPLPGRRRARDRAAHPAPARGRRRHPPQGAREARHRRAAKASGRAAHARRRRRRTRARHPRRDPPDGLRRVGRDAPPRQVEEGPDARVARPLAPAMHVQLAELVKRPTGAVLVTGPDRARASRRRSTPRSRGSTTRRST